jgi:uncharacterized protein YjbJ (UPF0337 family)
MSDATSDRINGSADELKGRAQKALGELTDNDRKKLESEMSKATGKMKHAEADTIQAIYDKTKELTDVAFFVAMSSGQSTLHQSAISNAIVFVAVWTSSRSMNSSE